METGSADAIRGAPPEPHYSSDPGRPSGCAAQIPPTKISIGIILCRTNAATNHPEVLLVHKRYTYAFAEFVHGRYARGRLSCDGGAPAPPQRAYPSRAGAKLRGAAEPKPWDERGERGARPRAEAPNYARLNERRPSESPLGSAPGQRWRPPAPEAAPKAPAGQHRAPERGPRESLAGARVGFPALRTVPALLGNMTTDELLDVWSLNFEQMWYRVWLSRDKRDLYNKKCAKFQSAFMRDDGGSALRRAVCQARSRGNLLWEVPKGRRLNPREADLICAVREMREETGIDKSEYRILPGVRRRVSYVSGGTRYVCVYYVAIANPRLAAAPCSPGPDRPTLYAPGCPAGRGKASGVSHMGEVSEMGWHDIERLRLLDGPDARLESLVAPAFRLMKTYAKGRWAARRCSAPPLLHASLGLSPEAERARHQPKGVALRGRVSPGGAGSSPADVEPSSAGAEPSSAGAEPPSAGADPSSEGAESPSADAGSPARPGARGRGRRARPEAPTPDRGPELASIALAGSEPAAVSSALADSGGWRSGDRRRARPRAGGRKINGRAGDPR